MELQSTALPTELREGKLPPRFELGVVDSKSTVLTNYTIGAWSLPIGIEPMTYRLTVCRSTYWAMEDSAESGVRTHACERTDDLKSYPLDQLGHLSQYILYLYQIFKHFGGGSKAVFSFSSWRCLSFLMSAPWQSCFVRLIQLGQKLPSQYWQSMGTPHFLRHSWQGIPILSVHFLN